MRIFFIIILCLFALGNTLGQTLYKYDIEVVKIYESGDEVTQLGLVSSEPRMGGDDETTSPVSLCFDYLGRLNILDSFNFRLVIYDDDFEGIESLEVSPLLSSGHVEHYEDYIASSSGNLFLPSMIKEMIRA